MKSWQIRKEIESLTDPIRRLERLFCLIEMEITYGHFSTIEAVLRDIDVAKHDHLLLIGLLRTTFRLRRIGAIKYWDELLVKVRQKLIDLDIDANRALRGLLSQDSQTVKNEV